jgi:hypothetical protein
VLNKRFLIVCGLLILVCVGAVGIYYLAKQPASEQTPPNIRPDGTDSSQPSATAPPEQQGEEDLSPFLGNLNILSQVYTDTQYFYINQVVMEFANNRLNKSSGLVIDPVSFGQRSDGTYGFSVNDNEGNRLFYVVVTKNDDDGGITVQEFE